MNRLLLALAIVATPALADRVASRDGVEVRLMDKPCPYGSVIRFIPEDMRSKYQKADATVDGKRYFACWREIPSGVHLYWEDGDEGLILEEELREEPGA